MKTKLTLLITLAIASHALAQTSGLAERFKQLDRNGDGKVSREEAGSLPFFDAADKSKDGFLTTEEVQAYFAARRTARPAAEQSAQRRATPPAASENELVRKLDIRYATMADVEAKFHSLDVYAPKNAKGLPVLIFIHGGGWRGGDKANPGVGARPAAHFCAEGFVFVSINYRLTPAGKHPVNIQDVAKAVAWVHNHIAEHGGDPNQLSIAGHSAGGHLAALIATDEKRLQAEGKSLNILKRAVLLDPAAYDIPRYLKEWAPPNGGMKLLYENAFGANASDLRDGSPQAHIAPGKHIPPMLMFYTGDRMAADKAAPAFADALTKAGAPSRAVDTVTLSHGDILSKAAEKGHLLSQLVLRFLKGENAQSLPAKLDGTTASPVAMKPATGPSNYTAPFPVTFTKDYTPGTKDRNGQFMGGTETMRLAAHQGMLFAGLGYWTDQPGNDPSPGAQILVKRGPDSAWELERNFSGALRINCMEPVTFTTDHAGKPLPKPVRLLLADAGLELERRGGPLSVWVRDDAANNWVESRVTDRSKRAYIRAFGFQRDSVTGVEHVFAGTGAGEVFAGVYDTDAPGRIRWNPTPEYANPDFDGTAFRRCQGFCIANGKAYASISPSLVERKDGTKPSWVEVFRWKPQEGRAGQGLRGITGVPDPKGGKHEVILGSREQEGRILRIDPLDNNRVDLELQSDAFLKDKLGNFRGGKLVAYNRFEPGKDPRTGKPIHWVTVAGVHLDDPTAAWLMIRHADAKYETVRVFDPALSDPPTLVSTRTLEFAPWSEREFYTGGYDGAANNRQNHNTAWIYKAALKEKP
jgi:acetyl esterase/lipase